MMVSAKCNDNSRHLRDVGSTAQVVSLVVVASGPESVENLFWWINTKSCSTLASLNGQNVGPCMVIFIPDMQNVHHRDEDRLVQSTTGKEVVKVVCLQRLHSSTSGNRACHWTWGLFGFRCFQMRLVVYNQGLERTQRMTLHKSRLTLKGKPGIGSGWVVVTVTESMWWSCLPVRALRTHGKSTGGALAQCKRSSWQRCTCACERKTAGRHRFSFFFWRRWFKCCSQTIIVCLFIKKSSVSQLGCFACLHVAYIHICMCYTLAYKYTSYQHRELKKHSSGGKIKKSFNSLASSLHMQAPSSTPRQGEERRGQWSQLATAQSGLYVHQLRMSITKLHCIYTRDFLHVQNLSVAKCKQQLSTLRHAGGHFYLYVLCKEK